MHPAEPTKTGMCVIDDEYRLVYVNEPFMWYFPDASIGDFCHRVLRGRETPCNEYCIASNPDAINVFFSNARQRWLETDATAIDWPGTGSCHAFVFREMKDAQQNPLCSLVDVPLYDELLEVDLVNDAYQTLHVVPGKYVDPDGKGSFVTLVKNASENLVHPDDRDAFLAFWESSTMLERLGSSPTTNMLRFQFRRRLRDGGWCWVLHTATLLRRNDGSVTVMCLTHDINEQKLREERIEQQAISIVEADTADSLTGLRGRSSFFRAAQQFLRSADDRQLCLMAIDIEHFKILNLWHGQEAGDACLREIGRHLAQAEQERKGPAGWLADDDFCIILPNQPDLIDDLQRKITESVSSIGGGAGFLPAFGLYAIDDTSMDPATMYDLAVIALSSLKGTYMQRSCWYDPSMSQELEEDHVLLSEIQRALENDEFTFYVQPECNMSTGKIVGFESLVRWNHPERGLIPPNQFVPLLERTGFITKLDLYVWERVFEAMRAWIDDGMQPVPISVNVSRVDLFSIDVADTFKHLAQRYRVDPKLIGIEITESAYAEEPDAIARVVDELRDCGFVVFMDDFGSGYSSLNMFKNVGVDVLKLDMKLLETSRESRGKAGRGTGVLEAIVNMARLTDMRIIAEGVETEDQRDFLLDIGCLFGQGYLFYRPAPAKQFEELVGNRENIDFRGIQAERIDHLNMQKLTDDNLLSETVLHCLLGGVAMYDVCDGNVELLRANEQYHRVTKTNAVDLAKRCKKILFDVYQSDRQTVLDIFERAYLEPERGAEGDVRRMRSDGSTIWMHMRVYFLREQDGHRLYYGAISNATEQKRREQQLESSQRALSAVVHIAENDEAFMSLAEENRRTAASIFAQMSPGGMIGGYCEDGFPLYFANREMVELLGYESYEELAESIGHLVANTIHPDDMQRVADDIGPSYYPGLEYTTTYRMPKKDGSWFWTLDKGKVVEAEDGRLAIVSACTDISEVMMAQERLIERNAFLVQQNQELEFLHDDMPGGYHRCADTPDHDFLYISQQFLDIFGYTREEIVELFDNKFMNMVHPDDLAIVRAGVNKMQSGSDEKTLEYRMLSKHGYKWVIDQSTYLEYRGSKFLQGVIVDLSETVKLRNWMQLIMEHVSSDIILLHWHSPDDIVYEGIVNGLFRNARAPLDAWEGMLHAGSYRDHMTSEIAEGLKNEIEAAIERRENYRGAFPMESPDGDTCWVDLEVLLSEETPEGPVYLCVCSDITTVKRQEKELLEMAERDALTGLYNRQTAMPKIKKHLEAIGGESDEGAALIMLDMDNFKLTNDVFGHVFGDEVISRTAQALKQLFSEDDIMCRIGGDEFLILCKSISAEQVEDKLACAVAQLETTRETERETMRFTVSAGYAMAPEQGRDFEELYQKADIALFAAKSGGKHSFRKYSPDMQPIRYELACEPPAKEMH